MKLFTNDSRLKDAVILANAYLQSDDFEKDVLSMRSYQHANVSPREILKLFKMFQGREVEVKATYFGMFWKRVLGRTIGDGKVYLNTSQLNREIWEIVGTIVHEATHVVDDFFPDADWGHGDNSSNGKEKTFSYYIGERATNWAKGEAYLFCYNQLVMKRVQLREVYSW